MLGLSPGPFVSAIPMRWQGTRGKPDGSPGAGCGAARHGRDIQTSGGRAAAGRVRQRSPSPPSTSVMPRAALHWSRGCAMAPAPRCGAGERPGAGRSSRGKRICHGAWLWRTVMAAGSSKPCRCRALLGWEKGTRGQQQLSSPWRASARAVLFHQRPPRCCPCCNTVDGAPLLSTHSTLWKC